MTDTTARTRLDPALRTLGIVIVVGGITAMLDMTMVAVALADLARAFRTPVTTIQWVSAAYLLAIAVVIPVTGRLAERFGARTMWMFALSAFLAGSALCGLAWSAGSLIAFRALQGVGGGMIVPLSLMILARAAGPEQRGRVMAIVAMPAQVAPIMGPLIGGVIVDAASWRWIFYVNVPVCLVALLLARRGIPADAPEHRGEGRWLDLTGLALLAPGLGLTLYGLSTSAHRLPLLAAGTALLVVFAVHASRPRAVAPLLNLRLFAHRPFAAATALSFLSRLSIFGVLILMPLYYQQVRGYGALSAGLLLAPQSLGTMLALPYVGRLTDRIGARPVVLAGIAVTTLGTLVFTQVGPHTSGVALGVALLIWGTGVAAVAVPVSAAAYEGLAPAEIPGATSVITTVQTVGASVGAAVLTAILAAHHDTAAGFAGTFWWVLGFTALTLVPAMLLPRVRGSR
ncbi:EmrB/QacA subfamily drug resistance transporter [Actinoallomurus bryophytorum]|uniref:EmrB/QacA subfamily drug resistance transporter n=1 Tax=Actinoallomurus bryophytorum TaxID=1490222 RepID=A0A543BTC9_9ACTN|nr:MDR family MFS transporter [Actinoallomurus bryophytorum]TQL88094.1 EmrB/QacA subfamily drug resistance transporter [Actinoallomurus bryophytorum]